MMTVHWSPGSHHARADERMALWGPGERESGETAAPCKGQHDTEAKERAGIHPPFTRSHEPTFSINTVSVASEEHKSIKVCSDASLWTMTHGFRINMELYAVDICGKVHRGQNAVVLSSRCPQEPGPSALAKTERNEWVVSVAAASTVASRVGVSGRLPVLGSSAQDLIGAVVTTAAGHTGGGLIHLEL